MAGRSASKHVGQKVKPSSMRGPTVGRVRAIGLPGRKKGSWRSSKTLATRLPKRWGG